MAEATALAARSQMWARRPRFVLHLLALKFKIRSSSEEWQRHPAAANLWLEAAATLAAQTAPW